MVGPTAVGKTALAIALAKAIEGEIVNADSRQIYRGMDIGTAKPTAAEQAQVPHHLIDVADPNEVFSAARYALLAEKAVGNILQRGKVPIIAGGTGLYIRALVDGISDAPKTNPPLRKALSAVAREKGESELHRMLTRLDPDSAEKIHPNDLRRVERALEITLMGGKPASVVRGEHGFPGRYSPVMIGLTCPRAMLYERIDQRVKKMILAGWLDETKNLLNKGTRPDAPGMNALGYRELVACLNGELDRESAVAAICKASRNYAKRQFTWFRKDDRICWLDTADVSVRDLVARVEITT